MPVAQEATEAGVQRARAGAPDGSEQRAPPAGLRRPGAGGGARGAASRERGPRRTAAARRECAEARRRAAERRPARDRSGATALGAGAQQRAHGLRAWRCAHDAGKHESGHGTARSTGRAAATRGCTRSRSW